MTKDNHTELDKAMANLDNLTAAVNILRKTKVEIEGVPDKSFYIKLTDQMTGFGIPVKLEDYYEFVKQQYEARYVEARKAEDHYASL